jgi:hypothetical protein
LEAGETTPVYVVVKAEDGSTKTYTINVAREQDPNYVPSDDALLASLTPSYGSLAPAFDQNTFYYAMNVPYDCDSITFTATTDFKRATCNVLGESNLTAGAENVFYVVVMAEDGTTTQIYTITVRRDAVYTLYTDDSYIQEIVNEIEQQTDPVVMDMSTAAVQLVSSEILTALKKNRNDN